MDMKLTKIVEAIVNKKIPLHGKDAIRYKLMTNKKLSDKEKDDFIKDVYEDSNDVSDIYDKNIVADKNGVQIVDFNSKARYNIIYQCDDNEQDIELIAELFNDKPKRVDYIDDKEIRIYETYSFVVTFVITYYIGKTYIIYQPK